MASVAARLVVQFREDVTCAWCQGASWMNDENKHHVHSHNRMVFPILKCQLCPAQFCSEHVHEFRCLGFVLHNGTRRYDYCPICEAVGRPRPQPLLGGTTKGE